MMKNTHIPLVCAGLMAAACGGSPPPKPTAAPVEVHESGSSAKDRKSVAVTVYNQNFGLIREVRKVKLGRGRVELAFGDVPSKLQPETVAIRAVGDPGQLKVLEQNYRYDLLTPKTLLDKYVGETVKVYRFNEKLGKEEEFKAEIVAFNGGQPVLRINGEVTYNFGGRFAFPKVPDNLIPEPTLVWLLDSKEAEQEIEVSYLTQNMGWKADYVMVVDKDDKIGNLTGWVTLNNQSGATYENAKLKLVAGDVQRLAPPMDQTVSILAGADKAEDEGGFHEEGFFEYHLYTLGRPVTIQEKEQKQVTLLAAERAGIQKKLIFQGAGHYYRSRYGDVSRNQKVSVYLDLQNTKKNGLGMALPKGTVRVYKEDKSGAAQFIGEDNIDHTPRDERVRIKMGEAFDVVADRVQMDYRRVSSCVAETGWEVSLRNHKDKAEKVEVIELAGGDWEMLESSHKHHKEDAHSFKFNVTVPARKETKITYRLRVRWC